MGKRFTVRSMLTTVNLGLMACHEKVNPAAAFFPTVFIPFVTFNDLASAVFGLAVMHADTDFAADNFQDFDTFSPALSPH